MTDKSFSGLKTFRALALILLTVAFLCAPSSSVHAQQPPGEPACAELPEGLISWWSADRTAAGATTFEDFQGNRDGLLRNNPVYDAGVFGDAVSLDGVDDFIQLPDNFFPFPVNGQGFDNFTFSVWFKTTGAGVIFGQQGRHGPGGSLPTGWVPGLYVGLNGKLYAEMFWKGRVDPFVSDDTVNDDQFHHVAVTYEGANAQNSKQAVYLDGVKLGELPHYQESYTGQTLKYQFGVGYAEVWPSAPAGHFYFQGLLDEFQLYGRALNGDEIRRLYDARLGGYCSLTVSGRITDVCGRGIPDEVVTLYPEAGKPRTATTAADGFYRFDRVPQGGNYKVIPPPSPVRIYSPGVHTFSNLNAPQTADFLDQTPVLWCPPQ